MTHGGCIMVHPQPMANYVNGHVRLYIYIYISMIGG